MSKPKVGIIGAAGYTGGELIRVLLNHPDVELAFAQSTSQAGKAVAEVHDDLIGQTDIVFAKEFNTDVSVLFFCQGHGKARTFLEQNNVPDGIKIVDLSQDFRHQAHRIIDHKSFVYGLPELDKANILTADYIANPGCFATAIQLALLPLAAKDMIDGDVHITGVTGATGAGQNPGPTTHFSWRNNNVSTYKTFTHQHLKEIGESLETAGNVPNDFDIHFIPYRGDFSRGIMIHAVLDCSLDEAEVKELYKKYYESHPFTHVQDKAVHLKQVVNTNNCVISVTKEGNKLLVESVIDNLLKGAVGQAVQNMNLMFGFEETSGLKLKASYF